MVVDTILTDKVLRPTENIVRDLLKLRDELYASQDPVGMKINSCLYSGYPNKQERNNV